MQAERKGSPRAEKRPDSPPAIQSLEDLTSPVSTFRCSLGLECVDMIRKDFQSVFPCLKNRFVLSAVKWEARGPQAKDSHGDGRGELVLA